jgi:hypothetical protein
MKASTKALTITLMVIGVLYLFSHSQPFAQSLALAESSGDGPRRAESKTPTLPAAKELRTITFEAIDGFSKYDVELDSIRVVGGGTSFSIDTVLVGKSLLVLNITTGIDAVPRDGGFHLSGNFSNPFTEQTRFAVFTPASSQASISLYNLNGKRVASSQASLDPGSSRFVIHGAGLPAGIYLLEVRDGKGARKTSKVVKAGSSASGSARIEYAGTISGLDNFFGKITEQLSLQVTGYADRYIEQMIDVQVTTDTTITFELPRAEEAPLITEFSADPTVVYEGDSVWYTVKCTDWDADLKSISIDVDDDGSFDASYPSSGDESDLTVGIPIPTAGSYKSRVRVEDEKGHHTEAMLAAAVIVKQKSVYTAPYFVSFSVDRSTASLEDTITFSVVVKDRDSDLKQLMVDYEGDGIWNESMDISGDEYRSSFAHTYAAEGTYYPRARVIDQQGLTADTVLSNAITVTPAPQRIPVSVGLVLHCSGNMGVGDPRPIDLVKEASISFLTLLEDSTDEVGMVWFTSVVGITYQLSGNISGCVKKLEDTSLPTSGGSAVWDGLYGGVIMLHRSERQLQKTALLFTNGIDNASARTPEDCIRLANRNDIRVYTLSFGAMVDSTTLVTIADSTGGRHYHNPSAAQLQNIFDEISASEKLFPGYRDAAGSPSSTRYRYFSR